jgi:hypothetical protein
MSDIVFECSHCQQSLVVDASGVGVQVDCPGCGREIVIPAASSADPDAFMVVDGVQSVAFSQGGIPPDSRHSRFSELLDDSARAVLPKLMEASAKIRRSIDQR